MNAGRGGVMGAGNGFFNVGGNAFSGNAFLPGGGGGVGTSNAFHHSGGDGHDAISFVRNGNTGDGDVTLVHPGKVSSARKGRRQILCTQFEACGPVVL